MDTKLKLQLVAANDPDFEAPDREPARRSFSVELDRRGVFITLGRWDVYLCAEPESEWQLLREPGGFDAQAWRLHLIVSRLPD
jgi:hypothetical protein